jgi:hypothetical protein
MAEPGSVRSRILDIGISRKDRDGIERLARLKVEAELDLQIFYIIGDANGPLADEVRIGFTKRAAYPDYRKKFQLYRSRKIQEHVAICISGEGTARRIKAAIQIRLIEDWRKISERWWKVTDAEIQTMMKDIIETEEIKVFSDEEADALEVNEFGRIMAKFAGV